MGQHMLLDFLTARPSLNQVDDKKAGAWPRGLYFWPGGLWGERSEEPEPEEIEFFLAS